MSDIQTALLEEKPVRRRRRSRKDRVRFADLMVGEKYQTKTSGQLVQVLEIDPKECAVTYRALSSVQGVGAGRATPAGETRRITNGHQWVAKLRKAPREEVV